MKAEINIPQEFVDLIADRVLQKILPFFQNRQLPISSDTIHTKKDSQKHIGERKPRMLSFRESAAYLGIAEKTLRNKSGTKAANPFPVKPKHIGGRVLFDMKDLDTYLDNLPTT